MPLAFSLDSRLRWLSRVARVSSVKFTPYRLGVSSGEWLSCGLLQGLCAAEWALDRRGFGPGVGGVGDVRDPGAEASALGGARGAAFWRTWMPDGARNF